MEYKDECIVYNYLSKPKTFSDNKIESMEYTILLNLYLNKNIEETKEKVFKLFLNNGFRVLQIQQTIIDGNGMSNTAIKLKKVLEMKG